MAFTSWQPTIGGLALAPVMLFIEGLPPRLTVANLAGFAYPFQAMRLPDVAAGTILDAAGAHRSAMKLQVEALIE